MIKKTVAPPYYERAKTPKKYIALLTQTGTSAPISTVIINEVGTVTWTRDSIGYYIAQCDEFTDRILTAITSNTDQVTIINSGDNNALSGDEIYINTYSTLTSAQADDRMLGTLIEITVY